MIRSLFFFHFLLFSQLMTRFIQVQGLPKFLKAVRLHSGLSKLQRDKVMQQVEDGEVDLHLKTYSSN